MHNFRILTFSFANYMYCTNNPAIIFKNLYKHFSLFLIQDKLKPCYLQPKYPCDCLDNPATEHDDTDDCPGRPTMKLVHKNLTQSIII